MGGCRACAGLTRAAGEHGHEQKLRQRVCAGKQLTAPVILELHDAGAGIFGEHQFEAIFARRKTVGPREPIVAPQRGCVEVRRDGQRDRRVVCFAKHEPGRPDRLQHDVAQMAPRKLGQKRFEIARDREVQFVDQPDAMNLTPPPLPLAKTVLATGRLETTK